MEKKKDIIKIGGVNYKTEAFLLNDYHPAIGNMLIIDGVRYVLVDNFEDAGRYVRAFTEDDKQKIQEYEQALKMISNKLKDKVDVERIIKENLKDKTLTELRVGMQILKNEEDGLEVTTEHSKGCYHCSLFSGDLMFEFTMATCDDFRKENQDDFEVNIKDVRLR